MQSPCPSPSRLDLRKQRSVGFKPPEIPPPTNSLVTPMLTDMYQISMAYAYWKAGKHNDFAVFDLFFRKNPFGGEFCLFAGLDEVVKFVQHFRFTDEDIEYLQTLIPHSEPEFFDYMRTLDCSNTVIHAMQDGSIVFPKTPLIRVEGPLVVGQLLETTLLNLVNFPSLIATNAMRMRLAVGPDKSLIEFGLRRAQGPDGAISASKYAYIGGFDATSNVRAGMLTGMDVKGTHAHAFVMTYMGIDDIKDPTLDGQPFVERVLAKRKELGWGETNEAELAAFIAYAQAFPNGFLALVDTYDTLQSGVPNYICVAAVLAEMNYKPRGIRLDSGDLAYLSKRSRAMFHEAAQRLGIEAIAESKIVASNDINEDVLHSLNKQGHEIDIFGVGTHLVTCQKQPALGCVYKLVEINGEARIKLSNDIAKIVIPARKNVYRLYGRDNQPIMDLIQKAGEQPPEPGRRLLARHPFVESKRAHVTPSHVVPLLSIVWDGAKGATHAIQSMDAIKQHCAEEIRKMREDHIRPLNPTPYKVSVSAELYDFMHRLWLNEAPIQDLS